VTKSSKTRDDSTYKALLHFKLTILIVVYKVFLSVKYMCGCHCSIEDTYAHQKHSNKNVIF